MRPMALSCGRLLVFGYLQVGPSAVFVFIVLRCGFSTFNLVNITCLYITTRKDGPEGKSS